jgi:hypothetical protein
LAPVRAFGRQIREELSGLSGELQPVNAWVVVRWALWTCNRETP